MKNNELLKEIKTYLINKLNDYKGCSTYADDLAYLLTECENANGSVYCNTYETKEFIKNNFDLFGDFLEYYENNFGELLNPFKEPEKAHVIFLIESCSQILNLSQYLDDNSGKKIELDEETINILINDINNFKKLEF